MFDLVQFYKKENDKIRASFDESLEKIKALVTEKDTKKENLKQEYHDFFKSVAGLILKLYKLEKDIANEYFTTKSFEELLKENNELYEELFPKNYEKSYANPSYSVKLFGNNFGQLISWFYTLYRNYISYAFYHKLYKMEEYNQLFLKVYKYVQNTENIDYIQLKELMTSVTIRDKTVDVSYRFKEEYNPEFRFYQDIIEYDNLDDMRYLLKKGKFIDDNEVKIARFLSDYPEEKLRLLAQTIVKGYIKGFKEDNKVEFLEKKSVVGIYYKIGLEKLYREIINEFRIIGLKTSIIAAYSTKANEQYDYDHRFDNALYLSEEYVSMIISSNEKGLKENKDITSEYSGILYIEKFGDPLFSPTKKKENLKLSSEQQKLLQKLNNEYNLLIDRYMPRSETSFCIVAFPTPKIGDSKNFEEIFEETLKINMEPSDRYERIQQNMIDILDKADYVHVKGTGANQTDIKIKIQPLENPETQTNFYNTGSSVNIPAGEVFTSPQLEGTSGILHVEETYQKSLRYDNLKLHFKDGYVTDYSCTNFDNDAENRKYIEENLLFPHSTLPMGEFAIGTNTLAYVVSRKYNILDVLPILISEKTGPHFAIGDTCYSREEDKLIFNQFNGKSIQSKDNEKSRLRETNIQEAYTNKHEDIVLAFDSIEFIAAVMEDNKKVDIIRDGRFVLAGTEELNIPLNNLRNA